MSLRAVLFSALSFEGAFFCPRWRAIPRRIAMQTATTTADAMPVSHQPSVASDLPASPVASRYDVVPLQAIAGAAIKKTSGNRRASVNIVAAFHRTSRGCVLVAEVALACAVGEL